MIASVAADRPIVPARRILKNDLAWRTSHLRPLGTRDQDAVIGLLQCWYHRRPWIPPAGLDWKLFWDYLERLNLSGLMGALSWNDLIGHSELSQLSLTRYFSNKLHHAHALQILARVQRAAQRFNLRIRVLKGPALVQQGYLDDGVRAFSDIDLLAGSHRDVSVLAKSLSYDIDKPWDRLGWISKLAESECVKLHVDGWELEFRYPLEAPAEPMFQMLARWQDDLVCIPGDIRQMLDPQPGIHLVFLIQHMAVHHLFSRFFWFMDLAVLYRQSRDRIDLEQVQRALYTIGLANAAAVCSDFCRKFIDENFPRFEPRRPAWNMACMRQLAQPRDIITGRYGIYHTGYKRWLSLLVYGPLSFLLVADPKIPGIPRGGFGVFWTLHRFRNALGFKKPIGWLDSLVGGGLSAILMPLARLVGWMIVRSKK